MIFDIYEQSDLCQIAKCKHQKVLIRWLEQNHITYKFDSDQKVIAHKRAVDSALGVEYSDNQNDTEPLLYLGEDKKHAA